MGFNPLDKRILLPLAVIVVAFTTVLVLLPQSETPTPSPSQANEVRGAPESLEAVVKPPGQVEQDERLSVTASYVYNPSSDGLFTQEGPLGSADKIEQQLKDRVEKLSKDSRPDQDDYRLVMQEWADLVRARGGAIGDGEREIYNEMMEIKGLSTWRDELFERAEKELEADEILGLRRSYDSLAAVDPFSNSKAFLERHKKAPVERVSRRQGTPDKKKEDASDE